MQIRMAFLPLRAQRLHQANKERFVRYSHKPIQQLLRIIIYLPFLLNNLAAFCQKHMIFLYDPTKRLSISSDEAKAAENFS